MTSSNTYFAALPESDIGKALATRVERYGSDPFVTGLDSRLQNAWQYYFGFTSDGLHATSKVHRGGEQGELAEVRVNHSRALVNALLNLVVSPKFVWTPRASKLTYETAKQTRLAAQVLEHYWHNAKVAAYTTKAVEEAIVFTEGFVLLEWDEQAGAIDSPEVDPETGEDTGGVVRTGDLRFTNVSAWDVIRNPGKKSWDDLDWVIVRLSRNKWDLSARYPEQAEQIVAAGPDDTGVKRPTNDTYESDDIPVYVFYHKPCAILAHGREVRFLHDGTVLENRNLDIDTFPLYRVTPADIVGKPYGYSAYHEILGLQEVADSVLSALTTNITNFGVQSVSVESGTNIQVDELAGMNVLYRDKGSKAPEGINLIAASPDQFKFLADTVKQMELLMGLNSVVRGEAQSDRLSGAALALLQSQALQQASNLQGNYTRMVESIGTGVIRTIRKRASIPLKIAIVGKNQLSLVQETEVDDESMGSIEQVYIELGNPLQQNVAGRYELAKEMLQMGMVKSPEQLQQVLDTGRLDPITRGAGEQYILVLRENEMISTGEVPVALLSDNHVLHGLEHSVPLSSPDARENPGVVSAYRDHMHEHYALFFNVPREVVDPMTGLPVPGLDGVTMDPMYHDRMLVLMGQVPPPPGPMAGGPGLPAGPSDGPAPSPEGKPKPAGKGKSQAPEDPVNVEAANGTPLAEKLPSTPINPASGQRWEPGSGGGAVSNAVS